MKQELEQKLYNDFPKLFRQKDLPITESAMGWGIDTPDEWFDVIYKACNLIQGHCDSIEEQIEFTQIKEKFGLLRMYCSEYDSYINGVIDMASEIVSDKNFKLRQFDDL